jgi:hypothetical protein
VGDKLSREPRDPLVSILFGCGEKAIRTAFKKEGFARGSQGRSALLQKNTTAKDSNGLENIELGRMNGGIQSCGVTKYRHSLGDILGSV